MLDADRVNLHKVIQCAISIFQLLFDYDSVVTIRGSQKRVAVMRRFSLGDFRCVIFVERFSLCDFRWAIFVGRFSLSDFRLLMVLKSVVVVSVQN